VLCIELVERRRALSQKSGRLVFIFDYDDGFRVGLDYRRGLSVE